MKYVKLLVFVLLVLVSLSLLPLAIALREKAEEVTLIARIDGLRFNPKAIESLNAKSSVCS